MKKLTIFLGAMLLALPLFVMPASTKAADPVVDKEFVPGFNVYGRYNTVFISACTRFTPAHTTYASYLDLAVKNDQGAGYPMKVTLRTALAADMPNTSALKSYTQTTFNNYAMAGNLFSRFTANDGQGLTVTAGSNYFICMDDLANNNATGWFYTASVSGGYTRMGYSGDVQNTFNGSFGYRTYYIPATQDGGTPGSTPATTGTTTTPTTGNSKVAQGSGPSTNISSAIKSPSGLTATHIISTKSVNLAWTASTTTAIGGYNVYRSETTGTGYTKIGDTGKTTLAFSDTAVTSEKTYYYMVRAYKDNAESANSNEASAQVKTASTDISVTTTSETSVKNIPWYKNRQVWLIAGLSILMLGMIALLILIVIRRRRAEKKA